MGWELGWVWEFRGLLYCGSEVRVVSARVSMVPRAYPGWKLLEILGLDVDDKSLNTLFEGIEAFGGYRYEARCSKSDLYGRTVGYPARSLKSIRCLTAVPLLIVSYGGAGDEPVALRGIWLGKLLGTQRSLR